MATCTVDGWRSRQSATWFPSSGFASIGSSTGGSSFIASNPSGNNKYTIVIRIKTPNDASIASINSITVSFKMYKGNTSSGVLYGSLRTSYSDLGSSDTASTYRNYAVGNEASATNASTSYTTFSFTFSGSISKNTYYYLVLYSKSNNDMFFTTATNLSPSATCTTTATTYTIKYNANGHGTAPANQTKTYGTALTLQKFIANQTGTGYQVSYNANGGSSTPSASTSTLTYKQTYWNTNSGGTGTNYSSGGSYTANAEATLYAIWSTTYGSLTVASAISHGGTSANYTVSYNANGGSSTPSNQTLTRTTAKSFKEWNTKSDGSGTAYSAGGSIAPTAATTLYATFTDGSTTGSITLATGISRANSSANGYTVKFDANGGECSTTSLTAINITKYTFKEWSGNDGKSYAAGASYSTSANLTLTASWNSTTINGSITLPTPTRSGYKFCGWATSTSATSGTTGNYIPDGDITLYAIWSQSGSVVYYNDNGSVVGCSVYYNDNGTPVLCMVFYNDNGTAVQI